MKNTQSFPSLQTSRRLRLLMLPVLVIGALGGTLRPASLHAAESSQFSHQSSYSQQELDRMLAPIALYPDTLLSQILMASTYPLEVVEASRWSRGNSRLRGEDAVRAVEREDWDPSVKSLVAFPQILAMMDEKLDWTKQLGDAFLDAEPQVMDTVQALRQRAMAAGNLQSNEHIRVAHQERIIVVEPASPRVVYVPYYDPLVIYGAWWWPAPPVYWAAWPGYYPVRPGVRVGLYWGGGITFSANLFFGGFDWPRRQVVHNHYTVVNRTVVVNRAADSWRHDPGHRRGVPYRSANVQQRFAGSDYGNRGPRRDVNRDSADRDGRPDFNAQRQTGPRGSRDNDRARDNRDGEPSARQQETRRNEGNRTPDRGAVTQRPSDIAAQVHPDRSPDPGAERRDADRGNADNRGRDRREEVRRDDGRRDGARRENAPDRDGRNDGGRPERRTQAAPDSTPLAAASPTAQGAPTLRAAPSAPVSTPVQAAPVQAPVRAEIRPSVVQRPAENRERPAQSASGNRPEVTERGGPGRPETARNAERRDAGERSGERGAHRADRAGEKGNHRAQREERG